MCRFALVIPNFNQSRFLRTALESLRHQTVPVEVVIMDGGSSDGFREAIRPYTDLISYWRSGPDGGQAAAIREGFECAGGDIIAWLNADDYLYPGTLDRVAAFFEAHPEADVVYGQAVHVDAEGFFLSYFPPIQPFDRQDLTRTCFICQPACFMRRSVYEAVGGINPSLRYTLDWDLWHRLARAGARFHYLEDLLAAVRYYPGTKTVGGGPRRYLEMWRVERTYGGRWIPRTWLGSYLYNLRFRTRRSLGDRMFMMIFNRLRAAKRAVRKGRHNPRHGQGTLYGFRRWEPVVEGRGIIRLPWYGPRSWRRLELQVSPEGATFSICINRGQTRQIRAREGRIRVVTGPVVGAQWEIVVQCREAERWHLVKFQAEWQ